MAKQTINVGTTANDGTGSTIRSGGQIINANFTEIYTALGNGTTLNVDTSGATANQVLKFDSATSKFIPGSGSSFTFTLAASAGAAQAITDANTVSILAGTGITTTASATDTVTVAIDNTVATLTGSQTLTNKTLTTPVISSISNTGTLTLPTSTDTLVGRVTTDTLTNKDLTATTNTFPSIFIADDTSSLATISLGETLKIIGGTGITTAVSGDTITLTGTASATLTIADDTSSLATIDLATDTLKIAGGTGITSAVSGDTITLNTDNTIATFDLAGAAMEDAFYISHRSPDSTITQTLTVTVATKTTEHTAFGDGSANGYLIDGHEGAHLDMSRGTYKFDQADATNSGHPIRFYFDELKNIQYSTGVTTSGTPGNAGAFTQIVIDDNTPTPLFYQCSVHAQMGGRVNILGGKRARLNITTDKSNVGDGSTVAFTILNNRSVDDILVFVNGICLVPTDDYTISTTTLTFIAAPASSAEIVFRYLG